MSTGTFREAVIMTERERVALRVCVREKAAWERFIREKYGVFEPYAGTESERAVREFLGHERLADVEAEIDRLVRAAARRPEDTHGEKNPLSGGVSDSDTVPVYYRWSPGLRAEFLAMAEAHWDHSPGRLLGKILHAHREGGVARRIHDKTTRVADDAEALLAELDPAGDGGMGPVEKRTVAIIEALKKSNGEVGEIHREEDLEEAIRARGLDSEPSIEKYTERVLDRLNYVPHAMKPETLFVPAGHPRAVDPDAPAIDRKEYGDLTHEERVRGLCVTLARRAEAQGGPAGFSIAEARTEVFGGHPSESHVRELMSEAGEVAGYSWTKEPGGRKLKVDLGSVEASDVLDALGGATDAEDGSGPDRSSSRPAEANGPGPNSGAEADASGPPAAEDVDAEMDRLVRAATPEARTDGGEP